VRIGEIGRSPMPAPPSPGHFARPRDGVAQPMEPHIASRLEPHFTRHRMRNSDARSRNALIVQQQAGRGVRLDPIAGPKQGAGASRDNCCTRVGRRAAINPNLCGGARSDPHRSSSKAAPPGMPPPLMGPAIPGPRSAPSRAIPHFAWRIFP